MKPLFYYCKNQFTTGLLMLLSVLFFISCGGGKAKDSAVINTVIGGSSDNAPKSSEKEIESTEEVHEVEKPSLLGKWVKINPKNKIFVSGGHYEYSATIHTDDSVRWKLESQDVISSITITEERTGKIIDKKNQVKSYSFQSKIFNTDVYTIKITDNVSKYVNISVERMAGTELSANQSTEFICDTIESKKGAKNAIAIDEVNLIKAVNEPRKIVLSGKLSFSGESKIILPLELPKETSQLLYELRISGENEESSEDGKLFNKVSTSVNQYKILGKTIFETNSTESSLTREILNAISLPKREKFSANVFFFPDEKNARAFTDGSQKGFNYDTKNSLKNTESMNGLIKPQKNGFVYLGFESTSSIRSTYIWLDAVAIQKKIRYVVLKKVPKESTSY